MSELALILIVSIINSIIIIIISCCIDDRFVGIKKVLKSHNNSIEHIRSDVEYINEYIKETKKKKKEKTEKRENKVNGVIIKFELNNKTVERKIKTDDPDKLISEIEKDGVITHMMKHYCYFRNSDIVIIRSIKPHIYIKEKQL